MDYIASTIHDILISNRTLFNLNGVDMSKKCNHFTVIIYYGKEFKSETTLGMHSGCVYFVMDGKYTEYFNSQVVNTPAVIYCLGDSRVLNWKKETS